MTVERTAVLRLDSDRRRETWTLICMAGVRCRAQVAQLSVRRHHERTSPTSAECLRADCGPNALVGLDNPRVADWGVHTLSRDGLRLSFHSEALVAGMVPVGWAGFTFLASSSRRERLIAYINAALAIGWLFLAWDSNIQFAF